ncbi:hypothetical protein AMS68_004622 [Peltaster fructicola]|uniref:beta-glucosidase n=1 Tax=Peltaster fructicola TaxID=286661 RepID=A0A6H0XWR8_9PEZI|nr:hypothetical protein AMS68_004622 [Peltaster fructicola]
MTLQEMNNITYGMSSNTGCVGSSGSVPRLGFPGFCLQDAGNGVRATDGVNSYASGISIGASWNSSLALQRGGYMGAEFRTKGVNVVLGPVVGPIGRIAEGGRNWEGFAADPYLDGVMVAHSITGLQQQDVIACVKHFVANEQETNRNPVLDSSTMSTSANIDDQTMHELYLWPFQDAVAAGVGAVMCSYNRINNTYSCENSKVINGLLKGELNFQGFVVSDWAAQHSGPLSANAGLDMAMPNSAYWSNGQLGNATTSGDLNRTRLVDMATRIVATWYKAGQDSPFYPSFGVGMPIDISKPHTFVNARDPAAQPSLLQQAIEGHVLVKNNNSALPLRKPKVMSIFGYDAVSQIAQDPAAYMAVPGAPDFWQFAWQGINLTYAQAGEIANNAPVDDAPEIYRGVLLVGGGSGSNVPAYISTPYDAIQDRAYLDGTSLYSDFTSQDPTVAAASDTCLVFINEFASETFDRPALADSGSDILVSHVASKCNNTIVVIHNAGIRLVDAWIDNPNVTAVIFAHLPGQDAGRALTQILYGDVSPSGRLPYTVAKSAADYGNLQGPCLAKDSDDSTNPQCEFTEGVNIDYRGFLAAAKTPRFPFGYGLTYSTFEYSALTVSIDAVATDQSSTGGAPVYTNGTTEQNVNRTDVSQAGFSSLFDTAGTITATVKNTGLVVAAEVAQLYILIPPGSAKPSNSSTVNTRALRGFVKLNIEPGASATATFTLRKKDISRWDTAKQAWVVPSGTYTVYVGRNVLDTPLTSNFTK